MIPKNSLKMQSTHEQEWVRTDQRRLTKHVLHEVRTFKIGDTRKCPGLQAAASPGNPLHYVSHLCSWQREPKCAHLQRDPRPVHGMLRRQNPCPSHRSTPDARQFLHESRVGTSFTFLMLKARRDGDLEGMRILEVISEW